MSNVKFYGVDNIKAKGEFSQKKAESRPTQKQIKTLIMFVYEYNIKISVPKTCLEASEKIENILKAIESDKVKKRLNAPSNPKVLKIDNVFTLCSLEN